MNEEILFGYCNRKGLKKKAYRKWFIKEYKNYKLDKNTLNKINVNNLANMKIKVIMATWCKDCRTEIPRFYKIMDKLNWNEDNLTLICVDHNKKADPINLEEFKFEKIATIIFYSDNIEIGRIIEKPKKSLEKDILEILNEN